MAKSINTRYFSALIHALSKSHSRYASLKQKRETHQVNQLDELSAGPYRKSDELKVRNALSEVMSDAQVLINYASQPQYPVGVFVHSNPDNGNSEYFATVSLDGFSGTKNSAINLIRLFGVLEHMTVYDLWKENKILSLASKMDNVPNNFVDGGLIIGPEKDWLTFGLRVEKVEEQYRPVIVYNAQPSVVQRTYWVRPAYKNLNLLQGAFHGLDNLVKSLQNNGVDIGLTYHIPQELAPPKSA